MLLVLCSAPRYSLHFFPLCWQSPVRQHLPWCWWSFSRESLCTWTETWQWPWTRSIVLCGSRFRFFYRSIHSNSGYSVKLPLWASRLLSGFGLGRLFQVAKIENDLVSIFGLPKALGLGNVKFILQHTVSPALSGSAWSLLRLWARRLCVLEISWVHGLVVPWECRFAFHGHAVAFLTSR